MSIFNGANGEKSSKRIIGTSIITWVLLASSWYFGVIQNEGKESTSIDDILTTALITGGVMITGGVAEGLFKKKGE